MISFQEPSLADRAWMEQCFRSCANRGCEYNFSTVFLWKQTYHHQVAQFGGYALERLHGTVGPAYLFPAGTGPLKPVLEALREDAAAQRQTCRLVCVTPEQREQLEQILPGQFQYTVDRDGFDYLYEIDRLADLGGKKLHAKRNHINRFLEQHPAWTVEEICMDNLADCAEMDLEWNRLYRDREVVETEDTRALLNERHALSSAFANYDALDLSGILLREENRVLAFTIGSRICEDTFDVHFEKAYNEIQGAYPLINREFARWVREHFPEIRYLNREDDMGMEGLRKAKESYYPDCMVEKYTAVWQDT